MNRTRDRYFKPIKDNRSVHQIVSTRDGTLTIRNLSCYTCQNCVAGKYANCQESCRTSTREVSVIKCKTAENDEEITEIEFSQKDTIRKGSLVAIYTDDPGADYYLIKASSECNTLSEPESDSWSNEFPKYADVIRGDYYEKTGVLKYKLIKNKQAIVSVNSILNVLNDIKAVSKIAIPEFVHENLIGMAEECGQM